jgi:hypothetical protein
MISNDEPRRDVNTIQVPYHELQIIQWEVQSIILHAGSGIEKGFVPERQPVMCDFEVIKHDSNPASFFIALFLEMENSRKAADVLSFSLSTVTGFEFRPNAVGQALPDDEQKRWHLFYAGVSTAIGMARGYLTNYLAPTIYKGYVLPLLNVRELVDRKYARPALPRVPSNAPSEKPPTKPEKLKE